jgi:RimJ/RimL family protein N-acetyltransferase
VIGSCSITDVYPQSIEASLGWHFGSQFWGKGYATEAALAQLFIGFKLKKVASIYADCFADNKASIRVMEKIGMTPFLNIDFFNKMRALSYGENNRTVRYHISRHQWLKR